MNYFFIYDYNKTHIKMEGLLDFKTKSLEELESYINDEGFIWACENGHLEVAQWLLSVKPDINISVDEMRRKKLYCVMLVKMVI